MAPEHRIAAGGESASDGLACSDHGAESAKLSALAELYDRHARAAYSLARRIVTDEHHAEDVVQEVFLSLWLHLDRYDPALGAFPSWLLAVTHHKAVDYVRREQGARRLRQQLVDDALSGDGEPAGASADDEVADRMRASDLHAALRQLSEAQRRTLVLAYFGGYTQTEIAHHTNTPLGTVKAHMLRGMRRLRAILATNDWPPPTRPRD